VKRMTRISDRMLSTLVPSITAAAASKIWVPCGCVGKPNEGYLYRKQCNSNGTDCGPCEFTATRCL
jgi:hypothetical protein